MAAQPQEVGSLPLNRAIGTSRIRTGQKQEEVEQGAVLICLILSLSLTMCAIEVKTLIYLS